MTQYLDATNAMPEYMPYPKFLLKMPLSATAKLIYAMLLDRYTLSRKNNWQDEAGHVYLIYTIEKLAEDGGIGTTAVKRALNELTAAGLIRRNRQGFSSPSRIYIMIPEDTVMVGQRTGRSGSTIAGCENNWKDWLGMHGIRSESASMTDSPQTSIQTESDQTTDSAQTFIQTESDRMTDSAQTSIHTESDQTTDSAQTFIQTPAEPSYSPPDTPHTDPAPPSNNVILNPVISNQLTQTSERAYGKFGNVMLTEEDYRDMSSAYADIFPAMLDFLSARIRDKQIPDEPHSVILRRMLE